MNIKFIFCLSLTILLTKSTLLRATNKNKENSQIRSSKFFMSEDMNKGKIVENPANFFENQEVPQKVKRISQYGEKDIKHSINHPNEIDYMLQFITN